MILFMDSGNPDQTVDTQADLGLHCPNMPENTFSHGVVQI